MKLVINILKKDVPELKKMFVDGGYDGEPFSLWAKTTHQLEIEVKRRPDEGVTVRDGIAQVPTNNPSEEQIRMAFEITRNGKKAFVVVSKRGCISSGWDGIGRMTNGVKRNEGRTVTPVSA